MKKIFLLLIPVLIISCENGPSKASVEIETATLKCWNDNWVQPTGFDISKGINLLDDSFFSKGLLGKRTVEDYKKFFNDTAVIYIEDSVKGSAEMNAALNSDYEGAPNIEAMVKCWNTNWFEKINTLDTSDVLVRTGALVDKLSKSGNLEFNSILTTFFTGLDEKEFNRPLVKDISYFIFWKTRGRKTHIQFVRPDAINSDDISPETPRSF
ncbi:hypothetical protein BH09BAC5_BH09BAC5_21740 [soil metagenome]